MNLKNKTILITGGTSGIGLEAVKQFSALGLNVVVTGRDPEKLKLLKEQYPDAHTIKSDVSLETDDETLLKQVEELGGIDILYNNAGIMSAPSNLADQNPIHFKNASDEINTNYLGVVRLNNLFLNMLHSRKEAAIINTTSILSYVPYTLAPTYAASKVALRFYTESLRNHLQARSSSIKVFELVPPAVATHMTDRFGVSKITPEQLVRSLINGLKNDQLTIRGGNTKLVYLLSRLSPKFLFKIINSGK